MKKLTPNQILQYVFYGIISILVLVIGGKVLFSITKTDPKTTAGESEDKKADDINKIVINKSALRYDITKYESLASQVYEILLGNWSFTSAGKGDFDSIKSMLNTMLPSELKQVYKSFGVRQAKTFGISAGRGYTMFEAMETRFGVNSEYVKMLKPIFSSTGLW